MLLDELFAQKESAAVETPAPTLTIEPVAVPTTGEVGRRAARQRLAELEDAARRNLRSAEEARRVLMQEHQRLQEESSARAAAQNEASALRRELGRLRESENKREAQAKSRARRAAREEIAEEIKRFHEEHDKVVRALDDHDGLLGEYAERLREEQQARAAMRDELEKAEAARRIAEHALERATETARRHVEDETIRYATTTSELADARSDVDRLRAKVAELSRGDEAAEIERLRSSVSALTARAEAAERERDDEAAAHRQTDTARQEAERLRFDAERKRTDSEIAVDAANARIAELEAETVRARADGDRLRAHAAALGDELAAVRTQVAELQAAASARTNEPSEVHEADEASVPDELPTVAPPPLARRKPRVEEVDEVEDAPAAQDVQDEHEPLPVRKKRELVPAAPAAPVVPVAPAVPDGFRRTAMAELSSIATSTEDDFAFRRR